MVSNYLQMSHSGQLETKNIVNMSLSNKKI